MYDLVSGRQLLRSSYVVGKKKALELFPMLKKEKLCGAIIYYDGKLLIFIASFFLTSHFSYFLVQCYEQYMICYENFTV